MRDVRIIDGVVFTLPNDPACYQPFARIDACTQRMDALRYGPGHRHWCPAKATPNRWAVMGSYTKKRLALVSDGNERVCVAGLVPWFVPQLLEFNAAYWQGHTAPAVSSADTVLGAL